MNSSRAVLLDEYHQEQFIIQETYHTDRDETDKALNFTVLELLVSDLETGRPISHAMVSMDTIDRTAVCDSEGRVYIYKILTGTYPVDVIVPGYIACTKQVHLSCDKLNQLTIKMIRNC